MKKIFLFIKSDWSGKRKRLTGTAISVFLASLLFSSSIALLETIQQPFDSIYSGLNGSHILLLFDTRLVKADSMQHWWKKQPGVVHAGIADPYLDFRGPLIHGTEKIDQMVQLTEFSAQHQSNDKLYISEGVHVAEPGYGEVWIPYVLATQNNIHVGDTIRLPQQEGTISLRVTATVVDPQYGSGMINPTRFWVRAGSLPFYAPLNSIVQASMGIRLFSSSLVNENMEKFNAAFHFPGVVLTYDLFRNAFLGKYRLIGTVLLVFAVLALFLALFMVSNAVTRSILDEFKLLGVMGAIGFTPNQRLSLLFVRYGISGILFLIAGIGCTILCMHFLAGAIASTFGLKEISFSVWQSISVAFILLTILLFLVLVIASRKAGKLKPAEAVRFGAAGTKKKRGFPLSMLAKRRMNFSALIACTLLTAERRKTAGTFLMMLFAVFLVVFCINLLYSLEQLKQNKPAWGFENGNIILNRSSSGPLGFTHEQLIDALYREKEIGKVTAFGYSGLTLISASTRINVLGKVYADDPAEAGLQTFSGRNAAGEQEIALCLGTARMLRKKTGDTVSVILEGETIPLHVSGIFQDISNLGQGFRLPINVIKRMNPFYEPDNYSILLHNPLITAAYKEKLLHNFGETISLQQDIPERLESMGILTNMRILFLMLCLFLMVLLAAATWNDMLITLREQDYLLGILKTIGAAPDQLRAMHTWKTAILCFLSLLIGVPASLLLAPVLLNGASAQLGIAQFPFFADWHGLIIFSILFLIGFSCFAWIISRKGSIRKSKILLAQ